MTAETKHRREAASAPQHDQAKAATALAVSALVPRHAPSILDLGKHLADVQRAYEAHDGARGDDETRRKEALAILEERRGALSDLIVTLPAQTIQDAAVQIQVVSTIADILASSNMEDSHRERLTEQVERVLFGVLPIVAIAAGMDMAAMGWSEGDALRVNRFAGVGVQS